MYYEDCELEDIHEFNKKMLQYMLWYNIERPHYSLNRKSPIAYFCDIINSDKSEFFQTGMTYTITVITSWYIIRQKYKFVSGKNKRVLN
jgi:hypothetical protein